MAEPTPEGFHTINPYLLVDAAAKYIDFLKAAFGAEETYRVARPGGHVDHATVRVGDTLIMLADSTPETPATSVYLYAYVPDVNEAYRRAVAAGATSTMAPTDQPYGDRRADLTDPFGNRWSLATPVRSSGQPVSQGGSLTLVPQEIDDYAVAHTTALDPLLDELIAETKSEMGGLAGMLSGPVEGSLLQLLIAATSAKRVLEIGMFTGYSALMMAAGLPDDGELVTCDINARTIAFGKRYFERSPHGHKIRVLEGGALDNMKTLQGTFDFVFIDADKPNYTNYYEAALPLLAPKGIIAVDNVLWSGRVLDPKDENAIAIASFNDHVQNDPRTINVMLTIRDGLMLIRRRN
jgi:caffeoyl-CoA O-methyltransferase